MYHFTVDKQSSKPIYLQIKDYLLAEINEGRLLPGQKIPSANDLSKQMGISRMTVLQALRELNFMGYLFSSHGKGTYVRKLEGDLHTLWGFTENFQTQGYKASSQLIRFERIKADTRIAEFLDVTVESPIFRMTRRRLLNDQPVGIETAHLVANDLPGFDQYDWNTESLYAVLKTRYELELVGGRNYIEAVAADETTARLLSIPKNTPVLATERISCLANHHPIEYVYSFYRVDLIRFKVDITPQNSMNILVSKIGQS